MPNEHGGRIREISDYLFSVVCESLMLKIEELLDERFAAHASSSVNVVIREVVQEVVFNVEQVRLVNGVLPIHVEAPHVSSHLALKDSV